MRALRSFRNVNDPHRGVASNRLERPAAAGFCERSMRTGAAYEPRERRRENSSAVHRCCASAAADRGTAPARKRCCFPGLHPGRASWPYERSMNNPELFFAATVHAAHTELFQARGTNSPPQMPAPVVRSAEGRPTYAEPEQPRPTQKGSVRPDRARPLLIQNRPPSLRRAMVVRCSSVLTARPNN